MSSVITCPSCKGAKKVMKLGGMSGNCDVCKGQGTVKKEEPVKLKAVTLEEFLKMDPEELKKGSKGAKYPHHDTDHHLQFKKEEPKPISVEDAKYETEYLTPSAQKEFVPPSKNMDVSNGQHKRTKKT